MPGLSYWWGRTGDPITYVLGGDALQALEALSRNLMLANLEEQMYIGYGGEVDPTAYYNH